MTGPLISRASVVAALWLGAGTALHACPVCFQFDDAPTAAGVEAAVLVLGGVTVSVLVSCAAFAVRLARRERTDAPAGTEADRP